MSNLHQGLTMGGLMLRALARWGDRVAFSGHGGSFTYAQSFDLVGRYQAAMQGAGAVRGQRMALLNANRAEASLAGVAAQSLGLCLTALHPLGTFEDQRFILEDGEVDYLFVDGESYLERGAELTAATERLAGVFTLGPSDYGLDIRAAADAAGAVSPVLLAQPNDISMLGYTGGTTGKPKGAMRRQHSVVALTNAVLADFEWPEDIVYLAVAPNSHVGGTKIPPTLLRGGRVHMHNGFDADAILDTFATERITATLMVPTMVSILLDHPKLDTADLSSLELLMYGAAPMSPTRLLEGLERIGPVFCQLYGQTEGYPLTVLRKGDHNKDDPGLFAACGHPVASAKIALLDEDCRPVARGEVGEICAQGPQVMDGYWQRPEQTAETLAGGWLHTGDMAMADERGYLYIVDRKKDMIITGGFNVFPREVEDVITTDPNVAMAAVIGVPDDKWGEAVKAVVVPRPNTQVDAEALIRRVRDAKGAVHAPKSVDIVTEIPLTPLGKPDKKALRETYWAGRDRRVG
ncbi:MAG: AMP-binding protein [Alphaproteobacteria bacterium]|nr:AMP-binding protein [Alphaproteobacteria bacterium]